MKFALFAMTIPVQVMHIKEDSSEKIEIRKELKIVIKSFVRAKKSFTEAYNHCKLAFGSDCMSRTRVFSCFNEFKNGRTDVKDNRGRHAHASLR